MTEAQAIEALAQRWLDVWPTLQPTVPFTFTNEAFEAPATWARVAFRHTVRNQATCGAAGARRFDSKGQIFVQLFGDVDRGAQQLAQLADDVRTVFESIRLGDLTTHAGSSREGDTDGRWAMHLVTIPFWYIAVR